MRKLSREAPPIEQLESSGDELDIEKNEKLFSESPSESVELLAINLARPDGFIKTLIAGAITTSAELEHEFGPEFVRTHRGYYKSHPKQHGHSNNYISFNVGRPQAMYAKTENGDELLAGVGFAIPAEPLIQRNDVKPSWGGFDLFDREAVSSIESNPLFEEYFRPYLDATDEQLEQWEFTPPKKDFLSLVHFARKLGKLRGSDQAEINLRPKDPEKLPRLSLDQTIILMPERSRPLIKKYIEKMLQQLKQYSEAFKRVFNIDLENFDIDQLLTRSNIYWYPQQNISRAVEYLSTHPGKIHGLLSN